MRSSPLLAAVLTLALTGCLQPVGLGAADGNGLGVDIGTGLPDASLLLADASTARPDGSVVVVPDGGTVLCKSEKECPPVVQTDPVCNPLRATCTNGRCGTERSPRIWDTAPGACFKAEECECQNLAHDKCLGSWLCTLNQCEWKCGGCTSDLECPLGEVCQEVSCGQPKQCVAGCRDGLGCPAGTVCDQFVYGKCGEPYGQCLPQPTCTADSDCPKGSICDWSRAGGAKVCQTGCHDANQCDAGEDCVYDACLECVNCPCFGHCEAKAACKSDAECGVGEVCGTDAMNCAPHCLPGCRDDGDCRADQFCPPLPPCMGCGCDHTTCVPRPVTCTDSAQCRPGEICAYDDTFKCAGERHCRAGCLEDADCANGGACQLADCGPCCPGWCAPPPGCQTDDQCADGYVCEPGPGCSGPKSCVPGCRSGSKPCLDGKACLPAACETCPCPDVCQATAGCPDDASCAPGYVCEPGPGCSGTKACVPGCRYGSKPCVNGGVCQPTACLTCPCPDSCEGPPPVCPMNQPACDSTLDCSWGASYCEVSCCQYCPVFDVAPCPEGKCMYGNGVGTDGCANGPVCGNCCACPAIIDPVCGTNYQTYSSSCEAGCAGATILHYGECQKFEGMGCAWGNSATCASGQYCRDACPMCDMGLFRCTAIGACEWDWDCPAGGPTPTCSDPNQKPVYKCADHKCTHTCQ